MSERISVGLGSGQMQFAVGMSAVTETLPVPGGGTQFCSDESLEE